MGKMSTLGGDGRLLMGEDKDVELEVLTRGGVPVDVAGWTTALVISAKVGTSALFTIAGAVSGTYDADPAVNTQIITFELTDTQTETLTASEYAYSAKRTDAGSERVLAYGKLIVEQANQV